MLWQIKCIVSVCVIAAPRMRQKKFCRKVLLKCFRPCTNTVMKGSFEGWVRKIIVNTALQRYRKRSSLHAIVSLDFTENHSTTDDEDVVGHLTAKELLAWYKSFHPLTGWSLTYTCLKATSTKKLLLCLISLRVLPNLTCTMQDDGSG